MPLKLIEIPLGPFTNPTGPYDHPCKECMDNDPRYHDEDEVCGKCEGTGRIVGIYIPCQRKSSEDDRIDPNKWYLAVRNGHYTAGTFSKQWYGWILHGGPGGGLQFNMIERLYEIVE